MDEINNIEITEFAKRHLDPKFKGTVIAEKELSGVIGFIVYHRAMHQTYTIRDGYANFCKIITIKNSNLKTEVPCVPSTCSKEWLSGVGGILVSSYSKRTEDELPVLTENGYVHPWVNTPNAEYLHLVVYNKEQILKEGSEPSFDGGWGIVSIQANNHHLIEPMKPTTMLRNALGTEYGGSGSELDVEAYNESVEFWSNNVTFTKL